MASELKRLDEELNRIEDLLRPLKPKAGTVSTESFSYATRIATEAIYHTVQVASDMAERLIRNNKIVDVDPSLKSICQEFIEESEFRSTLFARTHSIYSLATISTTDFIIRLRFWTITAVADGNSGAVKEFFETLRRLHVLRNIGSTIFIRHNIANLSYEMLLSTIPVIIVTAAVSFAFHYDKYDPTTVRLIYASTFSIATLPFILFAIRTIPIVHLTKSNSGLPFSSK
ncbi:MAG: hypothetical protein M3299_00070 [Thermoproteota archaeon]|nr:hypothetical protein [Thermoproteota archaeon]